MSASLKLVKAQKNPPITAIAIAMTLVTVAVYYDCRLWVIGFTLGLFLIAALIRLSLKAVLIIITGGLLVFQYQAWRLQCLNPQPLANAAIENRFAKLCVRPCTARKTGNAFAATIIEAYYPKIEERPITIQVKLPFRQNAPEIEITPDKLYLLEGRLESPQEAQFPFQFNSPLWLKRQQIFITLRAEKITEVASSPQSLSQAFACLSERIRKAILALHQQILGQDSGALLTSMVIGEKAVSLPESLKTNFRTAGLSHLLAASGLNLSILALTVAFLCSKWQKSSTGPSKVSNIELCLTVSLILCFTFLAGLSPSVLRATLMSLIAITAKWRFMTLSTGASLSLALIVSLLFDPFSVLDLGFALSYLATSGLIYIYPLLECGCPTSDGKLRKLLGNFLLKPALMVIASTTACLPIQLLCFPDANIYVIFSNVAAEPLVIPITIIGFVSSFVAALNFMKAYSPLGHLVPSEWILASILFLDKGIEFLLTILSTIANYASHLPGAHCEFGKPVPLLLAGYYFCLLLITALNSSKSKDNLEPETTNPTNNNCNTNNTSEIIPAGNAYKPAFNRAFTNAGKSIFNQQPHSSSAQTDRNSPSLMANAKLQAALCLLLLFLFLLLYTKTIAPTLEVYANNQSIYLRDGQNKLIRIKLTAPPDNRNSNQRDNIKDSVEWAFLERYKHLKQQDLDPAQATSIELEASPFSVQVKKLTDNGASEDISPPAVPLFYRFWSNLTSNNQATLPLKTAPENQFNIGIRCKSRPTNLCQEKTYSTGKGITQKLEISLYPNRHHLWHWLPWKVHTAKSKVDSSADKLNPSSSDRKRPSGKNHYFYVSL
jgi:ComEC/Rec2-related protein